MSRSSSRRHFAKTGIAISGFNGADRPIARTAAYFTIRFESVVATLASFLKRKSSFSFMILAVISGILKKPSIISTPFNRILKCVSDKTMIRSSMISLKSFPSGMMSYVISFGLGFGAFPARVSSLFKIVSNSISFFLITTRSSTTSRLATRTKISASKFVA